MCELITIGHKRMRARNFKHIHLPRQTRTESGFQLIELLVSIVVGTLLMASSFQVASSMYRATSSSENQVLATNMAQQLIDNARNSTYVHLRDDVMGGAVTKTQNISLYDYPANPTTAAFPRPLLRNENSGANMSYAQTSRNKRFNGTVTETLTNNAPMDPSNGTIEVDITIRWTDSRGPHVYTTGTTIAQTGIHN